uniref:Ycf55 n=1 Tax=Bostrychia tenella TaxID=324755 RepID=A0A1Z1M5P7_9FLOR|nr:hypothetical protein [Bostrychia tenella]ARW61161.1 hypothetical protein [Bostrychia tenella]
MIKYWPNKQSIKLNNAVVDLFLDTENKLIYDLSNITNYYLYIDILNNINKNKLFDIILKELKKLILDLVELNLHKQNLKNLKNQILYIFTEKIFINFLYKINKKYNYKNKLVNIKYDILTENLLIYLIFGSSYIDSNIFIFEPIYTPYKHVQILFENFIIQISNLIMENLFNESIKSSQINILLKSKQICNKSYISSRSIVLLLNNLKWQNFIYCNIYKLKCMYNERQQVWLISSKGIVTKYIYVTRTQEIQKLTKFSIFLLFCLELKDIIIPKLERILVQIGKYLIYFSINLFSNLIIVTMRVIIFYFRK